MNARAEDPMAVAEADVQAGVESSRAQGKGVPDTRSSEFDSLLRAPASSRSPASDYEPPPVTESAALPVVESKSPTDVEQNAPQVIEADVDGRRVRVIAQDEIVLQCGEASITLRRNGRIVIKGTYIETSSEGTNRIKGGQVRIN
jgi:hypothetical protein